MYRTGFSRFLTVAISIALALSGMVVLGSLAAGSGGEPELPSEPRGLEGPSVSDGGAGPTLPQPLSRAAIRAWAEEFGLPRPELDYVEGLRPETLPGRPGGPRPASASDVGIHKADQAHALGFNGTNITVAVVDTGQDLAHPDLFNVTARVTDTGSPYFLHPIVYDGGSMNDYLVFGEPSPTLHNGTNRGANSWYLNTTYSTPVAESAGVRTVVWTDGTTTFTWDVTGVAGLLAGEEVRIAFHPDDALFELWGVRPGVILFNYTGMGPPFDSVMADLDADLSFNDEKRAYVNTAWASFDPEAELIYQDITSDGVQDLSGGIVVFIADGVRKIPYAEHQMDALNLTFRTMRNDNTVDPWADIGATPQANLVPPDGDLVILYGDFNGPGSNGAHGTWTTSGIAGQGLTGGGAVGPVIAGMAPGAKIIGAGNNFGSGTDPFGFTSIYTAEIFATQGYDGIIQTGDEAHVASNSWGSAEWTGWSWLSRFVDYISYIQSDQNTVFVFSIGNSGPGYGVRGSPEGGASLISVGGMHNWFYRTDPWFNFDGGPNPAAGDLSWLSSHGPSAMGRHMTDVIANAHFAYGADPLNNNPFDDTSGTQIDGSTSWNLVAGTSFAAPRVAGVAALIYDAFIQAHGFKPESSMAKTILKQSADDVRHDPFLAGTGLPNARRAVLIANETDGLTLNVDEWNPGDYGGVDYPAYANLMLPGDSDVVTLTLENHRPTMPMDVTIADAVLSLNGTISHTFTRFPNTGNNTFLLNETGLMGRTGSVLLSGSGYASADLVRITMYFDRSILSQGADYDLDLIDWTDVDADGMFDDFAEENLMARKDFFAFGTPTVGDITGPNGWAYVYDPGTRTHDGLAIQLVPFGDPSSPFPVTLRVDYYTRADFAWLTASAPMVSLAPASTLPVTLNVTVPSGASPGLYEAVVLFTQDDGNVVTLPVVVNVAIPALPGAFGDSLLDSGIYQNGVQYGQSFLDLTGDYRYYFFDLSAPQNVTVIVEWDEANSDGDVYLLSHTNDWFGDNAVARYGPGTVEEVAHETDNSAGVSATAALSAGLNIIVVRSTRLAGVSIEEHPTGVAGLITVTPDSLTGAGVPVDGSASFSITSEMGFADVTGSAETGVAAFFPDQPVDPYPFPGGDFDEYLFGAPNIILTEVPVGALSATWTLFFHTGASDVDMGVFFDSNCDGVYRALDNKIGGQASTSANPEVGRIISPAAGCYWVHAAGFTVAPGSLFDLTFQAITTPFISVSSLPSSIAPGVPATVVFDYAIPHVPGSFGGTIFVGTSQVPQIVRIPVLLTPDLPPLFLNKVPTPNFFINTSTPQISVDMMDAPDAYETAVDPTTATISIDGTDMTGSATITASSITLIPPSALAQGEHTVAVQAADLAGSTNATSWIFKVDSVAPSLNITSPTVTATNNPTVVVAGVTDLGAQVTVDGVAVALESDGTFSRSLTLAEGAHMIPVVARDFVGNARTEVVDITVDTTSPTITFTSPADGATVQTPTVTVTGTTEAGASLTINGASVTVGADGSFSAEVALEEGENTISAEATDAAGNTDSATLTVTFTPPAVGFAPELLLLIGIIVAAAAIGGLLFFLYWRRRREWEEFGPPPEE